MLYTRPNYLPADKWRLAVKFTSSYDGNAVWFSARSVLQEICSLATKLCRPHAITAAMRTHTHTRPGLKRLCESTEINALHGICVRTTKTRRFQQHGWQGD